MVSPSRTHKKHKREKRGLSRERHRDHKRRSSTSPEYKRHRSTSRGRKDDRRHRSRSKSYDRSREYSSRREQSIPSHNAVTTSVSSKIDPTDMDQLTRDEREMNRLMGFSSFDSTKGKKVNGNEVGEVHVILKRKYRQYMNRKGGFNRPLDFVA